MINRAIAPEYVEPSFFDFKKVNTEILKGGIPLHSIISGTQDLIRLELIFKAGKWFEEKNGISFLTTKMLLEGSRGHSSSEISQVFERNGAFYEINPGLDHITFTIYTLTKRLDPILDLVGEIINYPSFPDQELETVKKISIQNLKVNKGKNSYIASRMFRENLFGTEHPYGRLTEENHIQALTQEDLFTFYSRVVKNNFEVFIAGKLSDKEYEKVKSFFGEYPKRDFSNHLKSKNANSESKNAFLDKAKSLQSSLKIGKKTISKSHEDFSGLLLLNEILGGYFGSRLMQNVREKKGYTYGIHSSIIPLIHDTYFVISSDIIKKYKQDALAAIYSEIDILCNQTVSSEELSTVKNYFKGNFLSSVNNVFSLVDKFKSIYYFGLDYDYYKKLFEDLDQTDADKLKDLANKYLSKESMTEVLVG